MLQFKHQPAFSIHLCSIEATITIVIVINVVIISIILLCLTPTSFCKIKILSIRQSYCGSLDVIYFGCAVSVKGDPGQEQVLTFLSNGIPFMTLTFSFHKLGVFFAVPHRFVTVVELEPPA